jgi:hypothetical protein
MDHQWPHIANLERILGINLAAQLVEVAEADWSEAFN